MSFRKQVKVLRQSPGTYGDDGRYTRGTSSEMAIMASVQPLGSQERYTVVGPEGGRNIAYILRSIRMYISGHSARQRRAQTVRMRISSNGWGGTS